MHNFPSAKASSLWWLAILESPSTAETERESVSFSGTVAEINDLITGTSTGTVTYFNSNDAPDGVDVNHVAD